MRGKLDRHCRGLRFGPCRGGRCPVARRVERTASPRIHELRFDRGCTVTSLTKAFCLFGSQGVRGQPGQASRRRDRALPSALASRERCRDRGQFTIAAGLFGFARIPSPQDCAGSVRRKPTGTALTHAQPTLRRKTILVMLSRAGCFISLCRQA